MTDIAAIAERERNLESLMPKFYNHLYIDGVAEVAFPQFSVLCSLLPPCGGLERRIGGTMGKNNGFR